MHHFNSITFNLKTQQLHFPMKPVNKKERHKEVGLNDEFVKKPVKKTLAKRDRKPRIYDPLDEEEDSAELDLFDYDIDLIDTDEEDDY